MPSTTKTKKSKKRVKPQVLITAAEEAGQQTNENKNLNSEKKSKKKMKNEDGVSYFYDQQIFLDTENYINKMDTNENDLQKFAQKIEEIGTLLSEKKDQIFYEKCEKELVNMNTDEFLNLFEENMTVETEEKEIESDSSDSKIQHIYKHVVYRNRLCSKDAYFILDTSTISKSQGNDKQEEENDSEEDSDIEGSIKLFFVDENENEKVICHLENFQGEEVEDDQILNKPIRDLIKNDFKVPVVNSKKVIMDDLVQGLKEYFIDRISENFPAEQ